ncbi:MAG: amidohydrolase family protein [Actinomycetales bacterium]|nr:amidohydrolase family protein [Actinomycetales bacterium]
MLVLRGTVVTMRPGEVVERGAVYLDDDGLIAAITPLDAVPPGFEDARRVTAGGIIYPGLIDLHNHLLYNSLPLWREPNRAVPWDSHNQWTRAPSYRSRVSAPANLLGAAAGRALLRYVETRAVVGGTTSVQGNPKGSVPPDGELVRNVDSERFGTTKDFIRVRTLVVDDAADLEPYLVSVGQGRGLVYHVAEGTRPALREEFALLVEVGLVRRELVAIHGTALGAADLGRIAEGGASLVWSPFSNLWLYGATADVAAAKAAGVNLCLGSDWGPSGTRSVLWEVKVADLWNRAQPSPVFTDEELVRLVTANPGAALTGLWPHPVGCLEKGALGDLVVLARRHADPYRNLVEARETDVRLVVVGGRARYGLPSLMTAAGATTASRIRLGRLSRAVDYGDPGITWAGVRAELEEVRADPGTAATRAVDALAAFVEAGPATRGAPFVLLPDMPDPDESLADAGPTSAALAVPVPPLQPLLTDAAWLAEVADNPFHGGLLTGLSGYR